MSRFEGFDLNYDWDLSEIFRFCRKKSKMEVDEIVSLLKFNKQDILDLEDGKFFESRSSIYVDGFVRSYAAFFKLDMEIIKGKLVMLYGDDKSRDSFVEVKDDVYSPSRGLMSYALLVLLVFYCFLNLFPASELLDVNRVVDIIDNVSLP